MDTYKSHISNFKKMRKNVEGQMSEKTQINNKQHTKYYNLQKFASYKNEKMESYIRNEWTTFGDMYKDIYDYENEVNKLEYSDIPEENLKMAYQMCLNKLKELNINILSTEFKPENFHNRNTSCLCGGCDIYTFKCSKNIYEFDVVYEDDCDCEPGILYVSNVKNMKTNEVYEIDCDLFCQNTSETKLGNLMCLLDCENKEQYFEKRYGKYYRLKNILNENEFECEFYVNNFNPKKKISVNDFKYNLILCVKTDEGRCQIIPHYSDKSDYILYIIPDKEYINEKKNIFYDSTDDLIDRDIDVNTFNFYYHCYSIKCDYTDDKDANDLMKLIKSYIKFISGNFGYYEIDKYYNHTNLNQLVKKYFNADNDYDDNGKYTIELKYNYDPKSCDNIDVLINVSYYTMNDLIFREQYYPEGKYPIDNYNIQIKYNSEKDKNNCELSISGMWHDVNYDFKKKYYESDDIKLSEKSIEINNLETVVIKGNFSMLYKIVDEFLASIYE